jgi:hypothetical protein
MINITGPDMLAQAREWYRKFTANEDNFVLGMRAEYQRGYVTRWIQDAHYYHEWPGVIFESSINSEVECESAINECNFLFRRAIERANDLNAKSK